MIYRAAFPRLLIAGACVCTLVVTYIFTYSNLPFAPAAADPLTGGWWGWWDQSQYLESARAFKGGNLDGEFHHYPPLYALMGAGLMSLGISAPFYVLNLISLSLFAVGFLVLALRYVGVLAGAIILLVTTIGFEIIRTQWVIPWTSTLAAVLFVWAFVFLDNLVRFSQRAPVWAVLANGFVFAALVGLIVPTRPVDAIVLAIPSLTYAGITLFRAFKSARMTSRLAYFASVPVALFALAIPVGFFLWFNGVAFSDSEASYFSSTQQSGIFFADIPEKLYSHLIASQDFYGENNADWFSQIPWLLLLVLFAPAIFLSRLNWALKGIGLAAILQLCLYYAFSDILPTGTFRYFNIHYFKWMFPLLGLAAAYWFRAYVFRNGKEELGRPVGAVATFVAAVFAVSLRTTPETLEFRVEIRDDRHVSLTSEQQPQTVDFVDVLGPTGPWEDVYFPAENTIRVDGRELSVIRDYRMFAIPDGLRVLFIRPVSASEIDVIFDPDISVPDWLSTSDVQAVDLNFGLGLPFQQQLQDGTPPRTVASIEGPIRFSTKDPRASRFVESGFSGPEGWGRWMLGRLSVLSFDATGFGREDKVLRIVTQAFNASPSRPVRVVMMANGHVLGEIIRSQKDPQTEYVRIPASVIARSRILRITFTNTDPRSPLSLGMSEDNRELGLGLIELEFLGPEDGITLRTELSH